LFAQGRFYVLITRLFLSLPPSQTGCVEFQVDADPFHTAFFVTSFSPALSERSVQSPSTFASPRGVCPGSLCACRQVHFLCHLTTAWFNPAPFIHSFVLVLFFARTFPSRGNALVGVRSRLSNVLGYIFPRLRWLFFAVSSFFLLELLFACPHSLHTTPGKDRPLPSTSFFSSSRSLNLSFFLPPRRCDSDHGLQHSHRGLNISRFARCISPIPMLLR